LDGLQMLTRWTDPDPSAVGATPEVMLANLGGPGLVRVSGRDRGRCRVVVTLLHGNEPSGVYAVHAWLRSRQEPAVDAVFIIASVAAALHEPQFSHRMLPDGRDLNRCFHGPADDREGALAAAILREIETIRAECVIDVHNNTGHNPAYAVATQITAAELRLASLFSHRFVHSDLRIGSLMEAVPTAPCVTIECGKVRDPVAERVARGGIDLLFATDHLESIAVPWAEMEILESLVRVRAVDGVRLAIGTEMNPDAGLTIASDLDRHNFTTVAAGTRIGWVGKETRWPVEARDASGLDRSAELFVVARGELLTRASWIPIMMTTDPVIARQDCLFYVVKRQLGGAGGGVRPAD